MHRFIVPDMSSPSHVRAVTGAVHGLDAHAEVRADPGRRTVEVRTALTPEVVAAAIEGAGFSVAHPA